MFPLPPTLTDFRGKMELPDKAMTLEGIRSCFLSDRVLERISVKSAVALNPISTSKKVQVC